MKATGSVELANGVKVLKETEKAFYVSIPYWSKTGVKAKSHTQKWWDMWVPKTCVRDGVIWHEFLSAKMGKYMPHNFGIAPEKVKVEKRELDYTKVYMAYYQYLIDIDNKYGDEFEAEYGERIARYRTEENSTGGLVARASIFKTIPFCKSKGFRIMSEEEFKDIAKDNPDMYKVWMEWK